MAIYTTFFVADPAQLLDGLPGWRLPLARPVRREARNPFTGKVQVYETREPSWDDLPSAAPAAGPRVIAIRGDYAAYLEARLPAFVRGRPHWAAKSLTQVEVEPLLDGLGIAPKWEPVLYPPPPSGAILQRLPLAICKALVGADLGAIATHWAAAMSTPDHTHSVSGHKLSDGWHRDEALGILEELAALSRKRARGERMFLLTEA